MVMDECAEVSSDIGGCAFFLDGQTPDLTEAASNGSLKCAKRFIFNVNCLTWMRNTLKLGPTECGPWLDRG